MKDNPLNVSKESRLKEAIDILKEREEDLYNLIIKTKKKLEKAPEGTLHVLQKKERKPQFYLREENSTENGGRVKEKYLRRNQIDIASALAQKEYDEKVIKAALNEEKIIHNFLEQYEENSIFDVHQMIHPAKRELINPIYISDEEYVQSWLSKPYKRKGFKEGLKEYYTIKGERVRSKSEETIANCLDRENIPFKYEYPLMLQDGTLFHPDFTILNVRERKVYYWEHLGKMDDRDYEKDAFMRLREYEESGIIFGKNLILTFETLYMPLNPNDVIRKIEAFLK